MTYCDHCDRLYLSTQHTYCKFFFPFKRLERKGKHWLPCEGCPREEK